MALEKMVSQFGNILKKSFTSKLESMGKDKTTPTKEDVFANPNLEQQGKFLGFDVSATLNDILTIAGIAGVIYFRINATSKLR